MRYRLGHLDLDNKMCQHVSLHIVEDISPQEIIWERYWLDNKKTA